MGAALNGCDMNESMRYSIPRLYYLVTPAFIALDYAVGVNVRVAVLDDLPQYKNLYYGFCILCGLAVWFLPRYSAVVALLESPVNLLITVLGMFLPYIENLQRLADLDGDWKAAETFSVEGYTNLMIAGIIAAIAFHESCAILSRRVQEAIGRQPPGAHTHKMPDDRSS